MRSAATSAGSAVASAITRVSVGPGSTLTPVNPNTSRVASTTQAFPGATTTSQRGTEAVPTAMAAMACAPETANTRSTWATWAASAITGSMPFAAAAVQTTISRTPATRAGMAVMSTDEASGPDAPGM